MLFPFSKEFSRPLKRHVAASEVGMVTNYIQEFINGKTADDIFIEGNQVSFDVNFFRIRWRGDIVGTIDNGMFTISDDNNGSRLTYKFYMYRMVGFICLSAIIGGFFSQQLWVALLLFCVGMFNWFIMMVRHERILANIVLGVNSLLDEHVKNALNDQLKATG
ncbi:hypothetical protein QTN47_05835 [Danxiaibacter flavus]|uniref:Uncharacterized protein n=1 Tax=Danxiaibacter flavus TaxID=3049108 RepID=A0ABV3ZEV4_9BACT|nr:hypothetical protein QNM32_05835 [Chitinophagaceae bacterium DXS]